LDFEPTFADLQNDGRDVIPTPIFDGAGEVVRHFGMGYRRRFGKLARARFDSGTGGYALSQLTANIW
jgi:hypothetical protein